MSKATNFIFISPNFPLNYWNFCRALKSNGINTLAIGDAPFDSLRQELRDSLNEYYKVSSLENYDEVYRACAFFSYKYGKIDWIESNNEYWLERDAQLRTDFNVNSGLKNYNIAGIKYKSKMKAFYEKAGVPTARYHLVNTLEEGLSFVKTVGYPVVVKPDNGVGAAATYRINDEKELKEFYSNHIDVQYIMEEYINGCIISYDGVAGKNREILFETSHMFPTPIMDIVNKKMDLYYYSLREIPAKLKVLGRSVVRTFDTNSRFFHCEFFILNEDKNGLGKKGDIVGMEVNMRPPGGPTPDMMNYANDIDVYKIWADMISYNKANYNAENRPYFCVYVGRRDIYQHTNTANEIYDKYKNNINEHGRLSPVIGAAMGDEYYIARFKDETEIKDFVNFTLQRTDGNQDEILIKTKL